MTVYQSYAAWSVAASSVIFAWVIIVIFQKYLTPAVVKAQSVRNDEILSAEQRRAQAIAERDLLQSEQPKLKSALNEMRTRSQTQAQRERERILEEARHESERLIGNAEGELDRARTTAKITLRQRLLDRSLSRARERAQQEMTTESESLIMKEFTNTLGTQNAKLLTFAGESPRG